MKISEKHGFFKPEVSDDILDSIEKYSENFQKIDDKIDEVIPNLIAHLDTGKTYNSGQKIWNSVPVIGGYAGWINIRTGVYAPVWQRNKRYNIGDIVSPNVNNGHYYQCVVDGTSAFSEPQFPTVSSSEVEDIANITFWEASTVYEEGDIVRKVEGDKNYFYQCIVSGTSGTIEPKWNDVEGVSIVDGSVTWYAHKTVKWKEIGVSCEFREFGKID